MKSRIIVFSLIVISLLNGQSAVNYVDMPVPGRSHLPAKGNFQIKFDQSSQFINETFDSTGQKVGLFAMPFVLSGKYEQVDLRLQLAYGISESFGLRFELPYRVSSSMEINYDIFGVEETQNFDGISAPGDLKFGFWNLYKNDYQERSLIYA